MDAGSGRVIMCCSDLFELEFWRFWWLYWRCAVAVEEWWGRSLPKNVFLRVSDTDVSDKLTGKFVKCVNLDTLLSLQLVPKTRRGNFGDQPTYRALCAPYIKEPGGEPA